MMERNTSKMNGAKKAGESVDAGEHGSSAGKNSDAVSEKKLKRLLVALVGAIAVLVLAVIVVSLVNSGKPSGSSGGGSSDIGGNGGGNGSSGGGDSGESSGDIAVNGDDGWSEGQIEFVNNYGAVSEITEMERNLANGCLNEESTFLKYSCIMKQYENVADLDTTLNALSVLIRALVEQGDTSAAAYIINSRSGYFSNMQMCGVALRLYETSDYSEFPQDDLFSIYDGAYNVGVDCGDTAVQEKYQVLMNKIREEIGNEGA